jgi:nitrate reductase alpha subunit
MAQPFDVKDWKKGECEPIPGKTMPQVSIASSSATIPTSTSASPRSGR